MNGNIFTYLGSIVIILKEGGYSENFGSRRNKTQGAFSQLKKVWKTRKINVKTKIVILEATVITVVKYGSETWVLRKTEEMYYLGYPFD